MIDLRRHHRGANGPGCCAKSGHLNRRGHTKTSAVQRVGDDPSRWPKHALAYRPESSANHDQLRVKYGCQVCETLTECAPNLSDKGTSRFIACICCSDNGFASDCIVGGSGSEDTCKRAPLVGRYNLTCQSYKSWP